VGVGGRRGGDRGGDRDPLTAAATQNSRPSTWTVKPDYPW